MPWHRQFGQYPSAEEEALSLLEWQALQYRMAQQPDACGRLATAAPNGLIEAVRLDYQRYQYAVALSLARDAALSLAEAEVRHQSILFPPAGRSH